MEQTTLIRFYNTLSGFAESNDEESAHAYLREHFSELPQEVQGELLTRIYFKSLEQKVDAAEAAVAIQEHALDALDALDVIEKNIRKTLTKG